MFENYRNWTISSEDPKFLENMDNVQRLVSPYIRHRLINNRNSKHLMELKYIVYITINLCNGKFYIGVHRTNPDTFDGYIGNSIYRQSNATENYPFHKAVRKYGYENFKRTTIKIFPDSEEGRKAAYELEATLVNETLLKSKNVYNIALGGYGSVGQEEKKRVYQFDLNGNYLRSFDCVRSAARYLQQDDEYATLKAIRNNCLGTTNSSFGYFWSYTKKFDYQVSRRQKKVAQYTISGKFLRYFDSIAEAERELKINTIEQALLKKYTAGGFQWRYYEGCTDDIPTLVTLKNKNKILPIIMYTKDMKLIKEFNCVDDCKKEYPDLSTSQINRVLNKIIKSHKGYIFKYKDEDIV